LSGLLLSADEALAREVHGRTIAAVLVALFVSGGELHTVFTRRRDDMRRHPGEISFPGGRREPEDPSLIETALREAHEEIGLAPDVVRIAGALAPTPTMVTGYAVYPFVGLISPGQHWTPSVDEVAEVLELSLPALRAGHARRRLIRRGVPIRTDVYEVEGALIWGATARMVGELLTRLAPLLG
jgi:8-oxo-dGTP pyrophosphatase MutT (NUDIX family)